jgi:hypothetical protein
MRLNVDTVMIIKFSEVGETDTAGARSDTARWISHPVLVDRDGDPPPESTPWL